MELELERIMEDKIKMVMSIVGEGVSSGHVLMALIECEENVVEAADLILHRFPSSTVRKTVTSSGGVRISTAQLKSNESENLCVDESKSVKKVNDCEPMVVDASLNGKESEVTVVVNGSSEIEKEVNNLKESEMETIEMDSANNEEKYDVGHGENEGVKKEKGLGSVGRSDLSFDEWLALHGNGHCIKKEEEKSEDIVVKSQSIEIEIQGQNRESEECELGIPVQTFLKNGGKCGLGFEKNNEGIKQDTVFDSCKSEEIRVKKETSEHYDAKNVIVVKDEHKEVICAQPLSAVKLTDEYRRIQMEGIRQKRKDFNVEKENNLCLSTVVIEDGDFPEEPDWLLVGRTVVTGLSTTKGRKLENNEIVYFAFPKEGSRSKRSSHFMNAKSANAASSIVRFSTKRSGEIGRLPMEWAKCLVPLVNSSKVKVLGRCIAAPMNLQLMQEIMLYVSNAERSSWKLEPSQIDTTTYPLLTLFKLLKARAFQKAEFSPEELDSRKRLLNLDGYSDENVSALPMVKKRKGSQQYLEQKKDEVALSESSLNKLVGAADMYDLEEMEPPETLPCTLKPYQKQALYWMTESETGVSVEEAAKTLHPCWSAYRICDQRAPAIYVNVFSGEATTNFPTAIQAARGGILADAMGLGKTVMTIALILARKGKGSPEDPKAIPEEEADTEYVKRKRMESETQASKRIRGGTLIVCPMALLSQWKDELETHSRPDSISVFIHYGGVRSDDPEVIAEPDVVLTTYGVLTSSYKNGLDGSIFHRVEWFRVVLDEAHTIKASKTQCAQAAFSLSSYCRWCLTGTPLQNNLEDLYSLLCFLRVEPWCNWAWWNKLVQRPYENGDPRGLKLVKAILRPLMLRRTKDSKDKEGRPILVLPPTDIQVIECEQSEAERDFYEALFKRSKVQFEQFVAQGKVLHNYANILELLLRLRQCCNHPFLVMSRGDTQEYSDLNKFARRFLETNPDSGTHRVPSRAYIEEVVEDLRKGENTECPICLESADDPVYTPCAHRMCRECLLSSWRSLVGGHCPICRQIMKKTELITCPSGSRFRVDVEKNWKESSKISQLLNILENIHHSGSGEKSIVFSQWTSFLDLLEIPLKRRKMGFLRFDGKLAQKQREKVLHEFAETKEKMVLLMSLKAGGVGLNLTAASNVFIMDPWWNPAVEEQAIMRIHRIGQKRTVRVRRFIVKDTVEERLQQVQARKQRMIAGALTDEEVRSARIEELKMLFR